LARLTYGIVAAALAALVAGFFVKTSTLPLILSIAFSAGATVLILIGWGRRLRVEQEHGVTRAEPEPELEEIDFIELGVDEDEDAEYRRPEPVSTRPPRRRPPKIAADAVVELPEDTELTYELPAVADEPPRPPRKAPKGKPKPKPKPVAPRRKPGAGQGARVVVIPGRGRYHTHSCRFATRDDAVEMTVATARRRGYEACSVCSPDEAAGFTPL